jgi:septum formation protein
LLAALVAEFEVAPSDIPEDAGDDPVDDAVRLAKAKALAVARYEPDALVIGCDTIVHDGVRSYGKPADAADAVRMLRALRGRSHRVVTGVAIAFKERVTAGHSEAAVTLTNLGDNAIRRYVASGRPLDKAGAYAIQDDDVPTVTRFEGCYCCVVGLPLWRLRALLVEAGVECADPDDAYERCRGCPERAGW